MLINQRVPIKEFTETDSMKTDWEKTIKTIQTIASKERLVHTSFALMLSLNLNSFLESFTKRES